MLSFENLRRLIIQGSGPIFCDYTVHHPGEVVVTTDIAGPPETVFEALIDPAQLNRYMADKAVVEPHVEEDTTSDRLVDRLKFWK